MASVQPKNSGGPITKFWEAPETVSALEHVKGWLCKHAKKVCDLTSFFFLLNYRPANFFLQHVQSDPPTAKSLAQLVSQMIQFQEEYLGKSVKSPPFTRLPVSTNCLPKCLEK